MSVPNVKVRVDPGDEETGSFLYLPLAAETSNAMPMSKIGLYMVIENDEATAIHLYQIKVSFSDSIQPVPPEKVFDADLTIGNAPEKYGEWGMKGGPIANGGEYIKLPYPPPSGLKISLYFSNFTSPVEINRSLIPHISPVLAGSYYFPAKADDLDSGEFWHAPESHWSGDKQLFAYDLDIIAWDSAKNQWSRLFPDTYGSINGTKNDHYLVWKRPVYAMAQGTVISLVNNVEDNPNPSPTGEITENEDDPFGNVVFIKHGDEIVRYAHLKKGSIHNDIVSKFEAEHECPVDANQLIGRVGNSGNTSNPHLHIHSTKGVKPIYDPFRPIPFHSIEVLSVSKLNDGNDQLWNYVDGKGLPAIETAIFPRAVIPPLTPIDVNKWAAVVYILFGVAGGGGGAVRTPGGKIIPIDPEDSYRHMSKSKKDLLTGLAMTEIASILESREARISVEKVGIKIMSKSIRNIQDSLDQLEAGR